MPASYITDKLRTKLNEIFTDSAWTYTLKEIWAESAELYEYLSFQVETVRSLKDRRLDLRSYLNDLDPGLKLLDESETPLDEEFERLLREQVFILNVLRIIVEMESRRDKSLLLTLAELRRMCQLKLSKYLETREMLEVNVRHYVLTNLIQRPGSLLDKYRKVTRFTEEAIQKLGLIPDPDGRPADFEQEGIAFFRSDEEVAINEVSIERHYERIYCSNLWADARRLLALHDLEMVEGEGVEHADGIGEHLADSAETTKRKKLMALLLLTYGKLEIPTGNKKETAINFFHQFIGGNRQNLRKKLYGLVKPRSEKELAYLAEDILAVKQDFLNLGKDDLAAVAQEELDWLREQFTEDRFERDTIVP